VSSDSAVRAPPAEDELTLARRVAQGDRTAFEILMRRYNRRLYRLARASLRDDAEAQDALQDAYLNAYRAIGSFRGDATLSTWLSRLVLNECGIRQRRSARRRDIIPLISSEASMAETESVADVAEGPDHAAARTQMRSILEGKVSGLPEALRVVFVLRSVEELSVAETAETLGITEEAVRLRLALLVDDRIEIPIHAWRGRLWTRVSTQVYNDRSDVDRLGDAVLRRVAAVRV